MTPVKVRLFISEYIISDSGNFIKDGKIQSLKLITQRAFRQIEEAILAKPPKVASSWSQEQF
jgi:hypothetical protein